MSKGIHFPTRMLALADTWRTGATETRQKYLDPVKKTVPPLVEIMASGLEVCAQRLEDEVRDHLAEARTAPAPTEPLATVTPQPNPS